MCGGDAEYVEKSVAGGVLDSAESSKFKLICLRSQNVKREQKMPSVGRFNRAVCARKSRHYCGEAPRAWQSLVRSMSET